MDDYLAVNGRSGNTSDQAYTLARLRKEERLLEANRPIDTTSQEEESSGKDKSDMEAVDEAYEYMNDFDRKLKDLRTASARVK